MREVEVKARIAGSSSLVAALEKRGCVVAVPITQDDRIFLHTSLAFSGITRGSVVLRVRTTDDQIVLTLKKQQANELDSIEREVTVNDAEETIALLEELDYREVLRIRKQRRTCSYQGMTVCLDEVEGLGSFIEVEQMTEEDDSDRIQEQLFDFLLQLGVSEENRVYQGYDSLLIDRQKDQKRE